MVGLASIKSPMMGLLLAVAYSNMVLDVIYIVKVHENQYTQTYPPAIAASLVRSILHMLYCLGYFVTSAKGVAYQAKNIAMAMLFFALFGVGADAAAIALKHNVNYCPVSASNYGNCIGVLRGTVGLGFALVGLDLIYIGYLAALVSKYGAWGKDLYNIPERKLANADLNDKAPAH
ncbi:hypothetical protein BD324DRAFT_638967 [Kockovaella imperatae]|uniref:MARVEL domain-containing protein n=1 Tax=Kockovaella imperatae TaxID=4999 RepID=A0A1Y1U6H1_9TREE|nr:hypothetical protein BD324DRAFT_638967 [Kockovaella imperatae]ORX33633.1 hypothetical protein BD324DRAFT_638967 [Kockovaella imperatae]